MPEAEYGLSRQVNLGVAAAPVLAYLPPRPRAYRPKIGLIGAGGIAEYHLKAYQRMGLEVAAICDLNRARAEERRQQFYPKAEVYGDYRDLLRRPDLEVVDAALHAEHRGEVVEAAIRSGRHVLSQKPFVLDLDAGERLIDLAEKSKVRLAVNHNGRWAPHFSYARAALEAGCLGELGSVDFQLAFDHSWTVGTSFEDIAHLILFDFGIHWFDMAACLLGTREVESVFASTRRTAYQKARPPFLACAVIDAAEVQVRMAFNAATVFGQSDRTLLAGSLGTLLCEGPSLSRQRVRLFRGEGEASPDLEGTWFDNGFEGTMGELLCAVESGREPLNSARSSMKSLALCFAAMESANAGLPVKPGQVRRMPGERL
jgi:predicted dehydrogenase